MKFLKLVHVSLFCQCSYHIAIFSYMFFNSKSINFLEHVANLPWRMNPKKYHHFGNFSYECDLVKYNCPVFCRDKKKIFVNSNINILQSTCWKFLKFLPHIFKPAYYKILWLHVSKNVLFFLRFETCTRNDSFGVFWVKT